ncbi:Amino Acid Transporter [Aphelenchoides besseyi]|nr:Amino Acid Transporter [Aphelenchoides besseyi]
MTQKLGLISCLAYCVGGMIGSSLFIAPSGVLLHAGSTGLSLILFLAGAIFSAFGALVYIELGCWIPESGGGFAYLTHAGWHFCAVPFFWLGTLFTYPMFLAIQTIALGQLLVKTLESWTNLNEVEKFWTEWALGNGLLVLISVLNMFPISKIAARFQVVATILKILVVLVIVSIGIDHLIRFGAPTALSQPFVNTTNQPFEVVLGLYSSLFCYSGWEVLNVVLGEIQNPKVTLPIASIGAILIVCCVSLAMNVAYFAVIEINAFAQTSAVAVLFSQLTMSRTTSLLVPAAIALLICGNLNMTIFGASRVHAIGCQQKCFTQMLRLCSSDLWSSSNCYSCSVLDRCDVESSRQRGSTDFLHVLCRAFGSSFRTIRVYFHALQTVSSTRGHLSKSDHCSNRLLADLHSPTCYSIISRCSSSNLWTWRVHYQFSDLHTDHST